MSGVRCVTNYIVASKLCHALLKSNPAVRCVPRLLNIHRLSRMVFGWLTPYKSCKFRIAIVRRTGTRSVDDSRRYAIRVTVEALV